MNIQEALKIMINYENQHLKELNRILAWKNHPLYIWGQKKIGNIPCGWN